MMFVDGELYLDSDLLTRLEQIIDDESAVIVMHSRFRIASGPTRFVCDSIEDLTDYLRDNAHHGDALWFWRFEECCTPQTCLVGERGARIRDAAK
jgi:hypothetical protein